MPRSFRIFVSLPARHQDAFKDNFVIQWVPESLRPDYEPTPSRPRVYMIDFELAVRFPLDSPKEERVCVGPPSGGSLPGGTKRPMAPETLSDKPYDPFKLDVWQLGRSFSNFKVPPHRRPRHFRTAYPHLRNSFVPRAPYRRLTQCWHRWWTQILPHGLLRTTR